MRRIGVTGLVFAVLAGGTLAACNFLLNDSGYTGGTGAASSASGTGASGSGGATVGTGGHSSSSGTGTGGSAPTTGIASWSASSPGTSVKSIAAGPGHTVYLTGSAGGTSVFGCALPDGGTASGYVVQLDTSSGACLWSFYFGDAMAGDSAEGTGVAVDPLGNVALTGSFTGGAVIFPMWPMMSGKMGPMGGTDSFVALFDSSHTPVWAAQITDDISGTGMVGDQTTTGVAINSTRVAVSGYYTNSLGVSGTSTGMPPSTGNAVPIINSADYQDAFAIWFDAPTGAYRDAFKVVSAAGAKLNQVANGVALDADQTVAIAGTTMGLTTFQSGTQLANSGGSIFVTAYTQITPSEQFANVLPGTLAQEGTALSFDASGNFVLGGDFAGTAAISDGGVSYPVDGQSMLLAVYDPTGVAHGSVQLGSDTKNTTVTVAGVAPWPVPGFGGGTSGMSLAFAGGFSGPASFFLNGATTVMDGGTGLTSVGTSSNVYVAKVDAAIGHVLWAERFGDGTGAQAATAVTVVPEDGSVLVAGQFQGTLDFHGTTIPLNPPTSAAALFVAKLSP